jgi:hypothetical protein
VIGSVVVDTSVSLPPVEVNLGGGGRSEHRVEHMLVGDAD